MMQRLVKIWAALAIAGFVIVLVMGFVIWSDGFAARPGPSGVEAALAMKLQDSSIPGRYEKMKNPLDGRQVNLIEAGAHYEEQCAVCHGDTGNGQPKFHGLMNPRPTDLRSDDTQEMSDGELYYVVKQGIRWSGMPAFGKPGDDDGHAWMIVAYVRHLPKLTSAEEQPILKQVDQLMDHGAR